MTAAAAEGPVVPGWTFADRMRKVRRDVLDLEQAEFAEMLGVKKQAYAAWETGRTHPRDILALARRVELVSRVPASWVLGIETGAFTGRDTREYPAATSITGRHLSLVRAPGPTYQPVSAGNGSSVSASTDAETSDAPRWAEGGNNAHSA